MPFSFGESINRMADAVLNAPVISTVVNNPLWMALVLTLAIVLIFMFVFRGMETDESVYVLGARSVFWIGALLTGALFLHSKILLREVDETASVKAYDGAFMGAEMVDGTVAPTHSPLMALGSMA